MEKRLKITLNLTEDEAKRLIYSDSVYSCLWHIQQEMYKDHKNHKEKIDAISDIIVENENIISLWG